MTTTQELQPSVESADELSRKARRAVDEDRDAVIALLNLARAMVAKHRDGKDTTDLFPHLILAVDRQRETAQARVIANAELQLERVMTGVWP